MGAHAQIVTEQQRMFGAQLSAIEPFTGGENHWSPAKQENPAALHVMIHHNNFSANGFKIEACIVDGEG